MTFRFTLTPDGVLYLENGELSYQDSIDNFLQDASQANVMITLPVLDFPLAGFELTAEYRRFILGNGWHYPMAAAQGEEYQPYVDMLDNMPALIAAKRARARLQIEESEGDA